MNGCIGAREDLPAFLKRCRNSRSCQQGMAGHKSVYKKQCVRVLIAAARFEDIHISYCTPKMGKRSVAIAELALVMLILGVSVMASLSVVDAASKLEWHYYKVHNTCRDAEEYVRHQVKIFWDQDKGVTPKLLRLLYSDCFVTVSSLFLYELIHRLHNTRQLHMHSLLRTNTNFTQVSSTFTKFDLVSFIK